MLNKFRPDCYIKTIYDLPVLMLKKRGIKTICFDYDNTLIGFGSLDYDKKISFIKELSKSFEVIIISNSFHGDKVGEFAKKCGIKYITHSFKPMKNGFEKASIDYSLSVMVGDQLVTDIFGAKRLNIFTILVDPINKKESFGTKINRGIEHFLFSHFKIKRGDYYGEKM